MSQPVIGRSVGAGYCRLLGGREVNKIMLKLAFFSKLEQANNILIAGAGGGYDIFSGLPLYFGLQAAGKEVYLASLSFSFLPPVDTERLSPSLLEVNAHTQQYTSYFPEKYLSQ